MNIVGSFPRQFNQLAKLYQRKDVKLYINLVLTIISIAFFAFVAIRPTLVTIARLFKEINEEKMVLQTLKKKIDNLNKAQQEYSLLKPNLYLLGQALPQSSQSSLLVGQLGILAQENNLILNSLQARKFLLKGEIPPESGSYSQESGEATQLSLSFRLTGEFKDIKNFLSALQSIRRIVNVEKMAFSQKGSGGILNLNAEVTSFYQPD